MARQPVPAFSYRSFNSTRNSALTDLTCSAALSALFCFAYVIPSRSDRRLRSPPPVPPPRAALALPGTIVYSTERFHLTFTLMQCVSRGIG